MLNFDDVLKKWEGQGVELLHQRLPRLLSERKLLMQFQGNLLQALFFQPGLYHRPRLTRHDQPGASDRGELRRRQSGAAEVQF